MINSMGSKFYYHISYCKHPYQMILIKHPNSIYYLWVLNHCLGYDIHRVQAVPMSLGPQGKDPLSFGLD